MKKLIYAILSISLISGTALAKKPGKKHKHKKHPHKHHKESGKKGAIKEERILDKKDTHGSQVEEGKDRRPSNIHEYHKHSFNRVKALLASGKITEDQGTTFKTTHTEITKAIATGKADGAFTTKEIASIRGYLDKLNDDMTAIAGTGEQDAERTPLLNKAQHKMEESIEAGIRSGRLSTLEANGLKRKLERLVKLEDRIKKDENVSKNEREKLFKEAAQIRRDMKKALFK